MSISKRSEPSLEKSLQHQRTVSKFFEANPDFKEDNISGIDPLASSLEINCNK